MGKMSIQVVNKKKELCSLCRKPQINEFDNKVQKS